MTLTEAIERAQRRAAIRSYVTKIRVVCTYCGSRSCEHRTDPVWGGHSLIRVPKAA